MLAPSRVAEGAGLNAQGYRQMKFAVPARNQVTAHHPAGLFPANLRHCQGLGPLPLSAYAGQAGASCRPSVGAMPPFTIKDSARSPLLPGLTGRSITMDERLCRSVRRSGPDDRCATVAVRHRHARR